MALPWFTGWLRKHLARHFSVGLPTPDDLPELYLAWEQEFEHYGIGEREADLSSLRLMSVHKPKYRHFPELVSVACDLKPKPGVPVVEEPTGPPPPPSGAELWECCVNARSGPFAHRMRILLREYILEGKVDPLSLPEDVYRLVESEPEKLPEKARPPRLRSA